MGPRFKSHSCQLRIQIKISSDHLANNCNPVTLSTLHQFVKMATLKKIILPHVMFIHESALNTLFTWPRMRIRTLRHMHTMYSMQCNSPRTSTVIEFQKSKLLDYTRSYLRLRSHSCSGLPLLKSTVFIILNIEMEAPGFQASTLTLVRLS